MISVDHVCVSHVCAVQTGSFYSKAVDIFNVTANAWSTALLSFARLNLAATSLPNHGIAFFAGGNGTVLVFVTV
jgi:hypothetical protein